jgi:hypothetical protein
MSGFSVAQAISRRLPRFEPQSDHVGFVVSKAATGHNFSEYFGFPCQFSIHRLFYTRPGWYSAATSSRAAEWTKSHYLKKNYANLAPGYGGSKFLRNLLVRVHIDAISSQSLISEALAPRTTLAIVRAEALKRYGEHCPPSRPPLPSRVQLSGNSTRTLAAAGPSQYRGQNELFVLAIRK